MGCREDSILVSYEVQNDEKDREVALYAMPLGGAVSVTASMVRASFPLPGNYHLRFKAPTSDGSFGGWVWIDLASDQDLVPVFNGGIAMKALRLPTDSSPSRAAAPSQASRSRPATSAQGASPHGVSGIAGDLMELDLSKAPRSAEAQAPRPPAGLQAICIIKQVAERQAREKREYEEKIKRHEEQKKSFPTAEVLLHLDAALGSSLLPHSASRGDAQSKKEKLELNDVLSKELNDWAKTPDGQSYKEIRTLLSTMHTVTWEGASWQPLNLSELVADSSIKKNYRKAILMVSELSLLFCFCWFSAHLFGAHSPQHAAMAKAHPASSEQQVRADRIFNAGDRSRPTMDIDLLNPDIKEERSKHKLKRMIQSPNSFFMDVKCPGCLQITTVFSHAQTVVLCGNCNVMLCQPTGGLARLTEGCSFRKKAD
ncbi:RPS27B [Symbiodinium pilosum]|uniref:RPS27B protein n=1 Tax=Symbiodinium pilosum TaxID=2952 RepID=A0A812P5G2_SYMPI|nr:RPS27B [Symbiodinium pilosum]